MMVSLLALSWGFFGCDTGGGGGGGNGGAVASLTGTWEYKMTRTEMAKELAAEMEMTQADANAMIDIVMPGVSFPVLVMEMVCTDTTWKLYDIDPKDGEKEEVGSGIYTIDGSTVTFSGEDGGTGTVKGNKLTIKDDDGSEVVLTKK